MEYASLGLAFLAGLVSIFSPCVLPLLPNGAREPCAR
jgi:cytochrome c biogenesis protein CcdA